MPGRPAITGKWQAARRPRQEEDNIRRPLNRDSSFARVLRDQISYETIAGGGQLIRVGNLQPLPNPGTATGPVVGGRLLVRESPARMEFQVDWLDHQRRGRRLVGVSDLKDIAPISWVELDAPKPLTSAPSWWRRLRNALRHRDTPPGRN
jgi:hypothetical protein